MYVDMLTVCIKMKSDRRSVVVGKEDFIRIVRNRDHIEILKLYLICRDPKYVEFWGH